MWQQQPTTKKFVTPIDYIVMWSNRGTTKRVQKKEVDQKIADGWVLAEEGEEVGMFNPIYDKGDVRHVPVTSPQPVTLPERNLSSDYLKIIQV